MKAKSLIVIVGSIMAVLFSAVSYGQPFTDRPPTYGTHFIPHSFSGPPPGGPSRTITGTPPPADYSCDGAPTIDLEAIRVLFGPDNRDEELQRYLDTSFSSRFLVNDVYRLCFINGPIELKSGVTFNRTAGYGATPVLISGLKINLAADAPLSSVSFTVAGGGLALHQAELHGEGNAAGLIVNGLFVRLHTLTIDGFNNGIEVNSNFVITEDAIVHGSGRVGSGIILRGRSDSIVASAIDGFNKGVEIWGENDFLGPDTYTPDQIVELYNNNIGLDVHQKARFSYIKSRNVSGVEAVFDPALGIAKPAVIENTENNPGKKLFAQRNPDGSIVYWLQFADAPESANVTIYKKEDGSYFGECTLLPEGKCLLSVSEDVRKSELEFWSLVDDPLFTMPFPDPFEFGNPIPISYIGAEPDVPIASPPGVSSGGTVSVEEGGGESGSQMTGSAVKSSGPGGCGGGGGATIVPPSGAQNDTTATLIMLWLIFAAPAVLMAVRIKKK